MSPISAFFAIMAAIGLADKLIGNKAGLGEAFDNGSRIMGDFLLFILGIYVVGSTLAEKYSSVIADATSGWFFDPAIIPGCILSTDMGAYPIATAIAHSEDMGYFSGIILGCTLGTLISFYLPTFLSSAKGKQADNLLLGFLYGIVTLPVSVFIGGLLLGIGLIPLLKTMLPIIILCALLALGLIKAKNTMVAVLKVIGNILRTFVFVTFAIVVFTIYFPEKTMFDAQFACDTVVLVMKITVNVTGALVTMQLIRKFLEKPLIALGKKLDINEYSIMALIVGMPGGIAMLPLLPKMDRKGQILAGAFSVSMFYIFGGQMAFTAAYAPAKVLAIYFITKVIGGVLSFALAAICEKDANKESQQHKNKP